jgi:hypothetical protein
MSPHSNERRDLEYDLDLQVFNIFLFAVLGFELRASPLLASALLLEHALPALGLQVLISTQTLCPIVPKSVWLFPFPSILLLNKRTWVSLG